MKVEIQISPDIEGGFYMTLIKRLCKISLQGIGCSVYLITAFCIGWIPVSFGIGITMRFKILLSYFFAKNLKMMQL